MERYGVVLIQGDRITTLDLCSSPEGMFVAKQLRRSRYHGEGTIAAVRGAFDEQGSLLRDRCTLLY